MSLISTKNFFAPFSNKVHLVTMLLVAIAFTVLRLSGGGFYWEKTNSVANTDSYRKQEALPSKLKQTPQTRDTIEKSDSEFEF